VVTISDTSRPPGLTFWEPSQAPAGFSHLGRFAVVPPQPPAGTRGPPPALSTAIDDVYGRGPDVIVVEQGPAAGARASQPPGGQDVDLGALGQRRGANAIAAILVFYWVLERLWPAPAGVLLKGMVIGGLYALIALGLALVYRANRIINFAQADLGGAPAALAVLLIVSVGVPYFVGILAGLVAGVVLGVVAEFGVLRRCAQALLLALRV